MPIARRPSPGPTDASRLQFRSGGALTAWTNSWMRGAVSYDAAVGAINAAGISTVGGLPNQREPMPVGWALGALRAGAGTPLRLVLPTPGDVRGIPLAPGLVAAATGAGQVVIAPDLALLPSCPTTTTTSTWQAWPLADRGLPPPSPGEQLTVAQAAGNLRLAVLEATDALATLDLARWHPEVETLGHQAQQISLPPDHQPDAVALALRGAHLSALLDLAAADAPGGAMNSYGATQRHAALRPLAVAVREALMTAFSWDSAGRRVDC